MEISEIDKFLEHFGVRGQKWGVRKFTSNLKKDLDRGKGSKARQNVKKTLKRHAIIAPFVVAGAMFAGKLIRDRGLAELRATTLHTTTTSKTGKKAALALMEAIPYGDFVRPLRKPGDE